MFNKLASTGRSILESGLGPQTLGSILGALLGVIMARIVIDNTEPSTDEDYDPID